MTNNKCLFLGAVLICAIPLIAQTASTKLAAAPPAQQKPQPQDAHGAKQRDGNDIFMANCARCHHAPESFPPSVSGTIVRHMRVRANLSKEDEQALLRFLNP